MSGVGFVSVSLGRIWLIVRAEFVGGIAGSRHVRQLRDLLRSGSGLGSMWDGVSYLIAWLPDRCWARACLVPHRLA